MARNPRAREAFFANYINILFMVLSIIQGLAFQDLAEKARVVFPSSLSSGDWIEILLTLLFLLVSFFVLIRVLTTYIAAALDYGPSYVAFWDILLIFLVGILEAFLFHQLDVVINGQHKVNRQGFWLCLCILSFVALIHFLLNVRRIRLSPKMFYSKMERKAETTLQIDNSITMFLISIASLVCCSLHFLQVPKVFIADIFGLSFVIILAARSNFLSLSRTFGLHVINIVEMGTVSISEDNRVRSQRSLVMEKATGDMNQIEFIKELLLQNYEQFLCDLFGVTRDRLCKLLSTVLGKDTNQTDIASTSFVLGYSNWYVVSEVTSVPQGQATTSETQPVGAVLCVMGESVHKRLSEAGKYGLLPHPAPKVTWLERFLCLMTDRLIVEYKVKDPGVYSELGEEGVKRLETNIAGLIGHVNENPERILLLLPMAKRSPGGKPKPGLLNDVLDKVLDELSSYGLAEVIIVGKTDYYTKALGEKNLNKYSKIEQKFTNIEITLWQRPEP